MSAHKRRLRRAAAVAAAAGLAAPSAALAHTSEDALTRAYRGADGSSYYQTVDGATVVGFGEHPGLHYAFVFKGTRKGQTISGRYWDVAKGSRAGRGALTLRFTQRGSRLTVTGGDVGPATFTAQPPGSWPVHHLAGFQSTSANDLDGAFRGDDGSRAYVREVGGDVVWAAERAGKAGGPPQWATVFIGQRTKAGIKGDWWDVPKGRRAYRGWFGAASTKFRRTRVVQMRHGVYASRAFWLDPDYRVDVDEIGDAIDESLEGNAIGFGWAIAENGKIVRHGGGGLRHIDGKPWHGNLAFNGYTENGTASTTKLVTAAMVIKALEARGKSVDERVKHYLPKTWQQGKGVSMLTFRQLLDHTAGLHYPAAACATNPYECLKQAFEKGRTRDPGIVGYHNIHYSAMRVLLPFLVSKGEMTKLFATEKDPTKLNQGYSEVFRDYFVNHLKQVGVTADFKYVTLNYAHWYTFPGAGLVKLPVDAYESAGSGGLRISAHEYAEFLAALANGRIVSRKRFAQMQTGYLGFDLKGSPSVFSDGLGEYWRKNGGTPGVVSQAVVFPDNVQVFVTLNSSENAYDGSLLSILARAYRNALD